MKKSFNHTAEQSILGAMIIDNKVIDEVMSSVTGKHFYMGVHTTIFNAIVELHLDNKTVDVVVLSELLASKNKDELVGGIAYLADLVRNTPSAANVMAYVRILIDTYTRRSIIDLQHKYARCEIDYDQLKESVDELAPSDYLDEALITWGSEGFDSETSYIIDGVMPENSFGVTYGASESFKSFLAIEQACCVSAGVKWNGRQTEEGLVVYVAGEGQQGIARRIKAWEDKTGLTSNVAVIGRPIYMDDVGASSKLISIIRQVEEKRATKVKLVVIDTLARCITGDENSATDMGAFIKACDKVKNEAVVAVNVIHHTGKDSSKGARGSSALRGACDFEYKVTRDMQDTELSMKVACSKMKDGAKMPPVEFSLSEVDLGVRDRYGKPITSLVVSTQGTAPIDFKVERRCITEANERKVLQLITAECCSNPNIKVYRQSVKEKFFDFKGNSLKAETKRKQFAIAIKALEEKKIIKVLDSTFLSLEVQ